MRNSLKTEELLKRVKHDYEFAKGQRDRHTSDWADARDQYNSEWVELQTDEEMDQWFYVPKTRTTISRIEAACQAHFFPPNDPKLGKIGAVVAGGDVPQWAEMLDKVLHAKVDIELNPVGQLQDSYNGGLIEGVAALKAGWAVDEIGNHAQLSWIPGEHVLWDPYALTPDNIGWFIHEVWLSGEQLWQRAQARVYEHVEELLNESTEDIGQDEWRKELGEPGNKMRRMYKLLEYWGPQQLVRDEQLTRQHRKGRHTAAEDVTLTMYKDKVMLRQTANPYGGLFERPTSYERLPFFLCTPIRRRGSTYGYSMVLLVKALQREVNWLRNQRRQAVDMEMTRKILYDRTRQVDIKAWLKARYGGFVGVNGPPASAVFDFAPRTTTANMAAEEQVVDADMRDLTGVTHYHMGSTVQGMQKTATGMSIVTEEGNVKMDVLLANIAQSAIIPLLRFYVACIIRWVPPEEVQQIIGSLMLPPPFRDLRLKDYLISVESGISATSKAARIQNIQYALQSLAQIANVAPELAIPAMLELIVELLPLLGVAQTARFLEAAVSGRAAGGEPAGAGMSALPNYGNEMQRAIQGRTPTVAEQAAPVGV